MTLLLVDDNRVTIDILAELIKPHLNNINEVICAYDGVQAFDIILGIKPNVIVTDIRMPNMDGIELITKIRAIDDYEPCVLIISSYNDFQYMREALHLNVMDYILKPVDQEELITKINELQCNQEEEQHTRDVFEELQQYIANHLGEPITLHDIADMLHYNAAYLGRVIKNNTGLTYNDYLLKLRVIKAQSLLVNTKDTIKHISEMVGFRDPEHFTKRFKMVVGLTPSQYRKKT